MLRVTALEPASLLEVCWYDQTGVEGGAGPLPSDNTAVHSALTGAGKCHSQDLSVSRPPTRHCAATVARRCCGRHSRYCVAGPQPLKYWSTFGLTSYL